MTDGLQNNTNEQNKHSQEVEKSKNLALQMLKEEKWLPLIPHINKIITLGSYQIALDTCNTAIKTLTNEPQGFVLSLVYRLRATCHEKLENFEAAIEDYDFVIRYSLENNSPSAAAGYLVRKAKCYINRGDHKNAILDCTKAIQFNPKNANAFFNRGYYRYQLKNYDQATEDFNMAIELDPKYRDRLRNKTDIDLQFLPALSLEEEKEGEEEQVHQDQSTNEILRNIENQLTYLTPGENENENTAEYDSSTDNDNDNDDDDSDYGPPGLEEDSDVENDDNPPSKPLP